MTRATGSAHTSGRSRDFPNLRLRERPGCELGSLPPTRRGKARPRRGTARRRLRSRNVRCGQHRDRLRNRLHGHVFLHLPRDGRRRWRRHSGASVSCSLRDSPGERRHRRWQGLLAPSGERTRPRQPISATCPHPVLNSNSSRPFTRRGLLRVAAVGITVRTIRSPAARWRCFWRRHSAFTGRSSDGFDLGSARQSGSAPSTSRSSALTVGCLGADSRRGKHVGTRVLLVGMPGFEPG
jgi:hypothetical protein